MSEREYCKLTVNILKEELKKRGLDQSGKKADLVARLESHDLSLSIREEPVEEPAEEPVEVPVVEIEDKKKSPQKDQNESGSNPVEGNEFPTKEVKSSHEIASKESHEVLEVQTEEPAQVEMPSQEHVSGEAVEIVAQNDHIEIKDEGIASENPATNDHQETKAEVSEIASMDVEPHHHKEDESTDVSMTEEVKQPTMESSDGANKGELEEPTQEIKDEDQPVQEKTSSETMDNSEIPAQQEKNETEEKPSEDVTAAEDARISNSFGIEMKREKDAFQIKWNSKKFTVPFIGEIILDLSVELSGRSFLVRPIGLEDVRSTCFQDLISHADKFLLDFHGNVLENSPGFAKFVCKTIQECNKFKEDLLSYKKDLVIESVNFEDQLNQRFLNRDPSVLKGSIVDRLLYVGNLPCDVAECSVRDLFPDALRVFFPPLKDLDKSIESARYAYLEFANADDVVTASEKYKEVLLEGEKLFVIKALCVRKERFGLLTDTLRTILLDKVRKMRKIQKNPWNKSRQELQEIEKAISVNMDKLATDSKHRKTWGMELGVLDESRLDNEEPERIDSIAERGGGRGGMSRGGSSRNSYDGRRGSHSSSQRYGGYSNNYSSYNSRGGWSGGNYYGSSGYANPGYMNQNFSGGYTGGSSSGSQGSYFSGKRKGNDSYGGDWKRGRNY